MICSLNIREELILSDKSGAFSCCIPFLVNGRHYLEASAANPSSLLTHLWHRTCSIQQQNEPDPYWGGFSSHPSYLRGMTCAGSQKRTGTVPCSLAGLLQPCCGGSTAGPTAS